MLVVLTKKITYHAGMDKRTIVGYDTTSSIYILIIHYITNLYYFTNLYCSLVPNEIIKKT